jgi:mono/diheme cytochrome c family protein
MQHAPTLPLLAASAVLSALGISGAAAATTAEISFNRDIRPILAENCFSCHGPDPGGRKAGLRLDTEAGLFEKRKEDPAPVLRGNAEGSELFKRLLSKDKDEVMPPPESHKALKPAEVALLKRWIDSGAPWQRHWSFIPPEKSPLPAVKDGNWPKNAVDRFVLANLEARGLAPAPEADPRVLFRRIHLDLTGLPPKSADVEAFLVDYQAQKEAALSQWIDRLMHSTAWGEHRARYWLDAARYGDTHGLHIDNYREMWPYRDWVIRAFNANKPFSEFTVEQIAGDLLPQPTDDQLIATGFQRCNITTAEGGTINEENLANYAADRVQTMGWVYLGLTMNCSQCHDHKFDPITARDYYSMAAFFRNTTQGGSDGNSKDGRSAVLTIPSESDRPRWVALPGLISDKRAQRDARRKDAQPDFRKWLAAATPDSVRDSLPSKDRVLWVPLDEGTGESGRVVSDAASSFSPVPGLEWATGGKTGAAPVLKKNATLSLGDVAGFTVKQPFSYGAWVKAPNSDLNAGILARMDSQKSYRGYDLFQAGKAFVAHIVDKFPEVALKVSTGQIVKPGTWQHVLVTYDGSGKAAGVKIFVDGKEEKLKVEVNTLKPDSDIVGAVPFRVGQRSGGSVFEGGSVQDVRVFSRAISSSEAKAIAGLPAIREALMVAEDKRPAPQKTLLFEHYLNALDAPYHTANAELVALEAERDAIKARSPLTHIQEEVKGKMPMANILMRGQYNKPGAEVEAVPPAVLHPLPEGAPKNRLGLAQWLVDSRNPLTPRVTVNRFWQEIFGQGIVPTTEDFGIMGASPSNVELLDWLAADFRDSGGDVRRLFKLILTSAAYRQSALVTPEKLEKDRDNRLLSRGPRFRMDAEMVRDYALTVSGLLASRMYGQSTRPYQPENIWDVVGLPGGDTRNYVQDTGESLYRRSLYTFVKRMAPPPSMDIFNAPSRDVACVRRERTNTPLQALVTMNDPQFVEAARRLAENAVLAGKQDRNKTVDYIIRQTLARPVSDKERALLLASNDAFLAHYTQKPDEAAALLGVGESKPGGIVAPPLLAAWTMVCNQVLNLDEALNK